MRWPSGVVGAICPRHAVDTIVDEKTVIDSPRLAAWRISFPQWRPNHRPPGSKTTASGRARLTPVATAGARPWEAEMLPTSR